MGSVKIHQLVKLSPTWGKHDMGRVAQMEHFLKETATAVPSAESARKRDSDQRCCSRGQDEEAAADWMRLGAAQALGMKTLAVRQP